MSLFARRVHTSIIHNGTKNYYRVLGVSRDASPKDIRAAFIRLSKQLHPDVNKLTPTENDISFVDVNEAYSVLSNPVARRDYDLRLTRGPLIQHYNSPNTSRKYGPGHSPYFYGSQQNMYRYTEEHRKFSNATVAGFLCIFIIFGGVLQFLRLNGFMKSQRAAAEKSRHNFKLHAEAIEKGRRNARKSKTSTI